MVLTADHVINFLERLQAEFAEHSDELTRLDSAIGDADHGINLQRGFDAVMEKLPALAGKDIGTIFKTTGMTLVSNVGGASGPLYGTAFIRAGIVLADAYQMGQSELLAAWEAALEGIQARGKARPGDKTMVDALAPAVDALRRANAEAADLVTAARAAADAAEAGMLATIPLQASKGRASYLGERSVGHQDPGATSTHLMLRVLLEVVEQQAV